MLQSLKRKIQNSVVYAYGLLSRGHSFICSLYGAYIAVRSCLDGCCRCAMDYLAIIYILARERLDIVYIIVMGHYNLVMLLYFMRKGFKCYSRRGA